MFEPVCVICKEPIWNPVSPKMVIQHALAFLDIEHWNEFLNEVINILNVYRTLYPDRFLYLDGEEDVPICWGCIYEIIYEILLEIDEKSAKRFKRHCCPYGL
jgi:hypothetical protein